MILKTEYFVSSTQGMIASIGGQNVSGADVAMENAKEKRNAFLKKNESIISEIVNETIQFSFCTGGTYIGNLFAVITLSYYEKNES